MFIAICGFACVTGVPVTWWCCTVFSCREFTKLRKATISFVTFFCPSAWKVSSPTGRIFVKFFIWIFFENMSRKFHLFWNLTIITCILLEDQYTVLIISRSVHFRMKSISEEVLKKINTGISCSITLSRRSCRLGDTVTKYCRAGNATDNNQLFFPCWIIQAFRISNTIRFSTIKTFRRTHLNVTFILHCLLCYVFESLVEWIFGNTLQVLYSNIMLNSVRQRNCFITEGSYRLHVSTINQSSSSLF